MWMSLKYFQKLNLLWNLSVDKEPRTTCSMIHFAHLSPVYFLRSTFALAVQQVLAANPFLKHKLISVD